MPSRQADLANICNIQKRTIQVSRRVCVGRLGFFMPKTEQINSECKAFVWLQNKLKGSYKPYTDKGRKAQKQRNLQDCVQEVLRDLKQTARTREQSVQTAKLLYSLADSALRLNVENTLSELTQEQSESEYIVSEPEQCMEFG